jgi:hypothetical protein
MIRRAAAVVIAALALNTSPIHAQDMVLTVTVPSADVFKAPTNVTPIIGHAPRGTVLPVSRNLGSWVKVAWPDAPDGAGYVHVTMGEVGPARTVVSSEALVTRRATQTGAAPVPAARPTQVPVPMPLDARVAPRNRPNVTPASHRFGVGALVSSTSNFGATARAWRGNHAGIQFTVTRNVLTNDLTAERITSMQVEPAFTYGLFDRVTDYVWFRPYVGSGVSVRRDTATVVQPVSDNRVGFRVFGGSELMFASAPQFGLSVDLGYRHWPASFAGFEPKPLTASVAGHWYVR